MKSPVASSSNWTRIEGLRIEVPVECFERLVLGEPGLVDAACHSPFAPGAGLCAQQAVEKAQVREALFFRPRQQFIQRLGLDRNA
jgi:hypothetical protein